MSDRIEIKASKTKNAADSIHGWFQPDMSQERATVNKDWEKKEPNSMFTVLSLTNRTLQTANVNEDVELIFRYLVERWRAETGMMSVFQRRLSHPAYKAIRRMGAEVLPLILRDLDTHPFEWLPVLHDITRIDPTLSYTDRSPDKMIQAWKQWGKKQNYIK
jgi:hypothetical protein